MKCEQTPVCCIAVWIGVIMLLLGIGVSTTAGYYLFNPEVNAIVNSNQLLLQLAICVFAFGILMIFINSTGIIVIWGKLSPQDDGCCDACEKSASCAGWIIYLVMTLLMIVFTIVLCAFFTFILVRNDPKSAFCPGITYDYTTVCNRESCKDGYGNKMEAFECPVDFAIISTVEPDSSSGTGTWRSLQDLFTMCGYYCNTGNCSLANGDSDKAALAGSATPGNTTNPRFNPYLFQLTGKYCTSEVKDASRLASPSSCENCNPEYVEVASPGYKVEKGASKTGLRDSFMFQVNSFGIPIAVFLYVILAVQILNLACMTVISCMSKKKNEKQYSTKRANMS